MILFLLPLFLFFLNKLLSVCDMICVFTLCVCVCGPMWFK